MKILLSLELDVEGDETSLDDAKLWGKAVGVFKPPIRVGKVHINEIDGDTVSPSKPKKKAKRKATKKTATKKTKKG